MLLCSLSDKYPWEKVELPYPPYDLNRQLLFFYEDGFAIK